MLTAAFSLSQSMDPAMTFCAESNKIFATISAKSTAEANVVNLKMLHRAATLTPPAIAFEHLCTKLSISYRIEAAVAACKGLSFWSFDLLQKFSLLRVSKQ